MTPEPRDCSVLVCITFLDRPARLRYLFQVLQQLCEIDLRRLDVFVFSETDAPDRLAALDRLLARFRDPSTFLNVISCPGTKGNLRLLPWEHKHLVKERFTDPQFNYTHFIYLEEDTRFSEFNFRYFLRYREELRPHGLVPSFVRVELNDLKGDVFLADMPYSNSRERHRISLDYIDFVGVDEPYCAIHVLDR